MGGSGTGRNCPRSNLPCEGTVVAASGTDFVLGRHETIFGIPPALWKSLGGQG